ncbi:unnamed protein product [Rhizophagus irregularis]|nr:unnamed protein product [Rhizophagus irregularis]
MNYDPYYINNQVTSVFPCLNQTGWVCYKAKTTSELEETPFEASAIKDLEYIRRYHQYLNFDINLYY